VIFKVVYYILIVFGLEIRERRKVSWQVVPKAIAVAALQADLPSEEVNAAAVGASPRMQNPIEVKTAVAEEAAMKKASNRHEVVLAAGPPGHFGGATMSFTLSSPEFLNGLCLPAEHTREGNADFSPKISWTQPPSGTKSYALIVEDLDALEDSFSNWVLFDIPVENTSLPRKVRDVGIQGRNSFNVRDYRGPCPPPEQGIHRYLFRLYALNVDFLGLPLGVELSEVQQAMRTHILSIAQMMCTYTREMKKATNNSRVHRENVP
jgi:Raf kinase inhibitor-like YbhB/YbcL family protein